MVVLLAEWEKYPDKLMAKSYGQKLDREDEE